MMSVSDTEVAVRKILWHNHRYRVDEGGQYDEKIEVKEGAQTKKKF